MGISPEEIADIEKKSEWHEYVAIDYVYHVLRGYGFTEGDAFKRGTERNEAIDLLNRPVSNVATPDELKEFLTKHSMFTDEVRELIEDYRFYLERHEQRRPEVWDKRGEWYKWIRHTN